MIKKNKRCKNCNLIYDHFCDQCARSKQCFLKWPCECIQTEMKRIQIPWHCWICLQTISCGSDLKMIQDLLTEPWKLLFPLPKLFDVEEVSEYWGMGWRSRLAFFDCWYATYGYLNLAGCDPIPTCKRQSHRNVHGKCTQTVDLYRIWCIKIGDTVLARCGMNR